MLLDNEEWDIQNATIADYSIEIKITPQHWFLWKNYQLENNEEKSFKEYFKKQLLNHLKK